MLDLFSSSDVVKFAQENLDGWITIKGLPGALW